MKSLIRMTKRRKKWCKPANQYLGEVYLTGPQMGLIIALAHKESKRKNATWFVKQAEIIKEEMYWALASLHS